MKLALALIVTPAPRPHAAARVCSPNRSVVHELPPLFSPGHREDNGVPLLSKADLPRVVEEIRNFQKLLERCPLSGNRFPFYDAVHNLLHAVLPSGLRSGGPWKDIDNSDLDRPCKIKLRELCDCLADTDHTFAVDAMCTDTDDGPRDQMLEYLDELLSVLCKRPPKNKCAIRVNDRRWQVGSTFVMVEESEDRVLLAVAQLGGSASKTDLVKESLLGDAVNIFKRLANKPYWKRYLKAPGRRGAGGYKAKLHV